MLGDVAPEEDPYQLAKKEFGLRVKELREAAGLTQGQLGKAVRYSARQMQRVEAGKTTPTFHKIVDMARVLGQPIHELFVPPSKAIERRPGNPRHMARGCQSET